MQQVRAVRQGFIFIGLLLVASAGILQAQTFSGGSITIPTGTGNTPANPYPTASNCNNGACIAVSGLTGSFVSMSLTLSYSNLNTQSLTSAAILLESPDGTHRLDVFSFTCGANGLSTASFTLIDSASSLFPHISVCPTLQATYKPAYYFVSPVDNFPAPGPLTTYTTAGDGTNPCSGTPCPSGTGTFANTFGGIPVASMNGTWKLFVADQGGFANNTVVSWSLTFNVTGSNAATTTTLSAGSPNPSFTSGTGSSVSFPAHVQKADNSGPATNGTVTLHDNTTNLDLVTTAINASGDVNLVGTFATEGIHDVVANYNGGTGFAASSSGHQSQTAVNHATGPTTNPDGSMKFCNGPVGILSGSTVTGSLSNPYPSEIILGGTEPTLSGVIQKVTVTLNGVQTQDPESLGFALQGPGASNAFSFLSFADGPNSTIGAGIDITLSDTGSAAVPRISQGICTFAAPCLPTDNTSQVLSTDPYPAPAPALINAAAPTGSSTFATEFGGLGVNGSWKLYLSNRATQAPPLGSVGSWCLNFTMQTGAHPTQTTVNGSPNPVLTNSSATLTADVVVTDGSGLTVNAGSVTFVDGANNIGSANVVNGVATLNNVTLAERTHHIVASYSGTNTSPVFGISSGHFNLRFDTPTEESGVAPYSFCNTGAIAVPGLGADVGVAAPYPSNVFVSNLPGTIKAVTVSLKQFSTNDENDLLSLLVGPGGNNIDFFSLTGSLCAGAPCANTFGPVNLITFDDTAANGHIAADVNAGGTFQPTSLNSGANVTAYPACPPNALDCASPPVGPPLPSNPFTPNKAFSAGAAIFGNATTAGVFGGTAAGTSQGNGTWSLYLDEAVHGAGRTSNIAGGWCVNLTENLPDISLTATPMTHSPTVFTRGQSASFTVTATNLGPGPTGIPLLTITDTLPTGLTFTGFTGAGWNCSAVGQLVTCTNPNPIAVSASSAFTINATVGNTTAEIISNSATLTSGTGGDDPAKEITTPNNTTSSGNITVAGTVLTINKTHTDPFTQGQVGATYSITVSNKGADGLNVVGHPGVTTGTIQVTDALPSSFSFSFTLTAVSGTGWTCQPPASGVSCTLDAPLAVGSTTNPITVTVTVANTLLGPVTNTAILTATTDQIGPAGNNQHDDITNITQVPTQMAANAGTTPQSATVNTAFGTLLGVTVKDAGNNTVPGVNVAFTAPGSGASGVFSNSTTTITVATNASGVASAPFTANTTAGGPYTVTAAATGLTTVNFSLTNTPGAPASMTANAGTTPQSATVNTAFANLLALTVKDAFNNLTPGVNVTFTAPGSGASGTFSNSTATITVATNASGVASAAFTANATAGGPYNVTAAATGVTTVNFSLTNTAGAPASMTANAGTTPQSATVSTAFANALAVTVKDAGNNPLAGVNVTFTAPGSGASGTFGNNTTTITVATNASGVASAPFTANATVGGPYTVTAAATGLTTVNFSLTNTAGAPASMTANAGTTPQSATINTAFANALAVTVKDAGNNPVSGVSVTFTAPGSGASGTFGNNTTTITVATNASGVASAPFTANPTAGGPYTVTAAATGLTTVNFSLTNTVGAPASMTANAGTTPQSATVSTAFANALAVTVKDAGNNPVSGVNVTFTAPGSGASGTFSNSTTTITVATNASGVASAPFTANATAGGPYTVTAAATGLTTVNFSLTNIASPATVTNVTSTTVNGSYGVGSTIVITMTFNKTVNVTGVPTLALNSGGTASYASGSGTGTLTFLYTVGAGQSSAHLDYASTSALTLNGGTINAILTLPPPGTAGSLGANKNIVINTAKTTPTLTWPSPAAITFGTPLGAAQLNATANVPGTFVYSPPAGTVLPVGNGQILSVTFTPTDTVNFNNASTTTTINVNSAVSGVQIVVTKVLSRDANNDIKLVLTLTNSGSSDANNVILTSVQIGSVFGLPRPQPVGAIPAGSFLQVTVTIPGSVGAPGTLTSLIVTATYTGGSVTSNSRVTLP